MANATLFNSDLHDQTQNFILIMDKLRTLKDRLDADAGLDEAAAAAAVTAGRTDLAALDFQNWNSAITQLLFAYDSGAPTQKSYLYKIL